MITRTFAALLMLGCLVPLHAVEVEEYPHKDTPEASIYRGSIVFEKYCQKCHGPTGEGNGRAAKLYDPPPANLVTSDKDDVHKELIIRNGGKAIGRSEFMPPWGEELTDEQVEDVVRFLGEINRTPVAVN